MYKRERLFIWLFIVGGAFANRADPDQAALVRAAWSGSTLFAYENMIRYDSTLVDLASNVQTCDYSLWMELIMYIHEENG